MTTPIVQGDILWTCGTNCAAAQMFVAPGGHWFDKEELAISFVLLCISVINYYYTEVALVRSLATKNSEYIYIYISFNPLHVALAKIISLFFCFVITSILYVAKQLAKKNYST